MHFWRPQFDQRSKWLINTILKNFQCNPMYVAYRIEKNEILYSDAGAIAIILFKNEVIVNMFLFYPSPSYNGKIDSIAIYGSQLEGHKRIIESSMKIFDLPVERVEWDEGIEKFVDVTLQDYDFDDLVMTIDTLLKKIESCNPIEKIKSNRVSGEVVIDFKTSLQWEECDAYISKILIMYDQNTAVVRNIILSGNDLQSVCDYIDRHGCFLWSNIVHYTPVFNVNPQKLLLVTETAL